jgi:hypothetical protein
MRYVQDHVDSAIYEGDIKIDGHLCKKFAFEVSEADKFNAFRGVSESTERGGRLVLYIAPALGYSIPKIEIVGSDHRLTREYLSQSYQEYKPGLFIPRFSRSLSHRLTGVITGSEFEITKIELLNEPIPEAMFQIYLPATTRVHDRSDGKTVKSFIVATEGGLPYSGLEPVVTLSLEKSPWWRSNRWVAFSIGAMSAILVAFIVRYLLKRRTRIQVMS